MAKPIDREGPIQRSIVAFLRRVLPGALVHHSPNEHRRKRGTAAMLHAKNNKLAGTVTGFPDLVVMPPAELGAFFLEVKAEGRRVPDAQKEVHDQLRSLGYRVAVVRSIEDVRECLSEWGVKTAETGAA